MAAPACFRRGIASDRRPAAKRGGAILQRTLRRFVTIYIDKNIFNGHFLYILPISSRQNKKLAVQTKALETSEKTGEAESTVNAKDEGKE